MITQHAETGALSPSSALLCNLQYKRVGLLMLVVVTAQQLGEVTIKVFCPPVLTTGRHGSD